jgi:hypothetical protein
MILPIQVHGLNWMVFAIWSCKDSIDIHSKEGHINFLPLPLLLNLSRVQWMPNIGAMDGLLEIRHVGLMR